MGRDDWYRKSTWSKDDQDAFFDRLGRSRGPDRKAQYARIQALYLEEAGHLAEAQELLDLVLSEWPEPFELASAYLQKATCHVGLGASHEACLNFQAAVEAEDDYPSV